MKKQIQLFLLSLLVLSIFNACSKDDESASKEDQRHCVKYQFEGDANTDNVTVYKNDLTTSWPVGEIIYVDDLTNFSFAYDSQLVVRVSTTDGQTLTLSPGVLHEFTNIMTDITITIAVRKEDQSHKVKYQFEGEANASNVKVFKGNLTTSWGTTDDVEIPYGNDFTFGYTSDLAKVAVRVSGGQTCPVTSGEFYTLNNITSDITLIISAPTQHRITYEYKGTLDRTKVSVQGTTEIAYPDWTSDKTLYVAQGDPFIFRYDKQPGYMGDITVTLNGEVKGDIAQGMNFTLTHVNKDMHFILYDRKHHTVKIVTNLPGQEMSEMSSLVVSGENFELTLPSGSNFLVKVNGKILTPVGGKYLLQGVTKDTEILITADKGMEEPDLNLKADVHVWDGVPVVDGGVIVPDNN